jgi:ERCC4-type nuclease
LIIIEDSRESKPLSFKHKEIDMVVRAKLDYGDYSSHKDGEVCPVYFERKSIGDLFGTLSGCKPKDEDGNIIQDATTGIERFKAELKRCSEDGSQMFLIIEGTMKDVVAGYKYSRMKGLTILRILFTMFIKYKLMPVFCSSRREMALYISEFYYSYWRNR